VPIEQAFEVIRQPGIDGIISIHAGHKANSIESIGNSEQFLQRIKYDITSKYVSLMEIGRSRDIHAHLTRIFPDTG